MKKTKDLHLNPITGTERRHLKLQYTVFITPSVIREILQRELADQGYIVQDRDIDFRIEELCEQPTFTGAHITIRS